MIKPEKINYVELSSRDLPATKAFFQAAFGWDFVDYGPDYASFSDQGIDGGFFTADQAASTNNGSALVILYSERLEESLANVERAGGQILKPIFSFPGGRRFHFAEPGGNELAVWGEL